MGILTNIKQKTDSQKKVISLVVALVLTLVIVVVWFSFSSISVDTELPGESAGKLSSISPWQTIKDEFSSAFSKASTSTLPIEIINESTSTATTVIASSTNI